MVGSVLNEGLRGMANSQREMQKTAQDIAKANIRPDNETLQNTENQASTLPPVEELSEGRQRGLEESLIELRRQEQLFTANATVVKVADETLGSIIDVKS